MTVNFGLVMWGKCSICDCDLVVVQIPELAEHLRGHGVQVILLNTDTANCDNCGAVFSLPAAEVLDVDRCDFGRSLQAMADEFEDKTA